MKDQTSSIPKEWEMTTLGEVADVNNLTIDRSYAFNEIEYIDVASVEERKLTGTQKLKLEDAPSRAKRIVSDNSILISTVRPNLKHYCFIKKAKPNLVASTGFAVVDSKKGKSDPYFLYNLLTTEDYTDYLIKIADSQTSTYPAFNPSIIQNSDFLLPSFAEQHAIAAVLSPLDDKIELLRKQNKTLEATAQVIFKEWFVNFNFPGATGKMIDSEVGEIPEGCGVGKIEDLCKKLASGGTPATNNADYYGGDIDWFSTKELQDNFIFESDKKITEAGLESSSAKVFPKGSVVMAIYAAPTVGRLGILGKDATFNQAACGFVANEEIASNEYIYLLLLSLRDEFNNLANGAAQQNLNVGLVKNFAVIIPDKTIMAKFKAVVTPIFEKIHNDNKQIKTLSSLRDVLLPKLIKGKVRVEGFSD